MAYRSPGAANLYPADAAWSLPVGLHSHGLARLVAIASTRGSFEAAQAVIERATGVHVGKRQNGTTPCTRRLPNPPMVVTASQPPPPVNARTWRGYALGN